MATRNLHSITESSNQSFFIPLRVNPNHHGKTRSSLKRRRSQKDGIQATQRHLSKRRWRAH
uniref:Putative ovule protein n=1 Tax=Solanum chacoense TaxID=4108 RepID=A0A0V0GW93_SOLCH